MPLALTAASQPARRGGAALPMPEAPRAAPAWAETLRAVGAGTAAAVAGGALIASAPLSVPLALGALAVGALASFGAREAFDTGAGALARMRGKGADTAHESLAIAWIDLAHDLADRATGRGEGGRMGSERRARLARDTFGDAGAALLDGAATVAAGAASSAVAARVMRNAPEVHLAAAEAYVHELNPTNVGRILTGDNPAAAVAQAAGYALGLDTVFPQASRLAARFGARTLATAAGGAASSLPGNLARVGSTFVADLRDGHLTRGEAVRLARTGAAAVLDTGLAAVSGGLSGRVGAGTAFQAARLATDGATNAMSVTANALIGEARLPTLGEFVNAGLASVSGTTLNCIGVRNVQMTSERESRQKINYVKDYDFGHEYPEYDWLGGFTLRNSNASYDRVRVETRAFLSYRAWMMKYAKSTISGDTARHDSFYNSDKSNDYFYKIGPISELDLDSKGQVSSALGARIEQGYHHTYTNYGDELKWSVVLTQIKNKIGEQGAEKLSIMSHGRSGHLIFPDEEVSVLEVVGDIAENGLVRQGGCLVLGQCNLAGTRMTRSTLQTAANEVGFDIVASDALNPTGQNLRGRVYHFKPEPRSSESEP